MTFRQDMTWGVASAAYQIEGSPTADGKGLSVWDMFCRKPGAVWRNQNADLACDYYNRWPEDIALMKSLGIRAYRFSVSWPRIFPEGVGHPWLLPVVLHRQLRMGTGRWCACRHSLYRLSNPTSRPQGFSILVSASHC